MDADIFVSGKKKLRIQKYPDTCGRGLREVITIDIVDKSRQITATEVQRKICQKRLSKQMGKMFS